MVLGATDEFHYLGQDGPSVPGISQMGSLLAAVSSTCPKARGQKTVFSNYLCVKVVHEPLPTKWRVRVHGRVLTFFLCTISRKELDL